MTIILLILLEYVSFKNTLGCLLGDILPGFSKFKKKKKIGHISDLNPSLLDLLYHEISD